MVYLLQGEGSALLVLFIIKILPIPYISEISALIQQVNKIQGQLDTAFDVCEVLRTRLGMDPNEMPDLNEVLIP